MNIDIETHNDKGQRHGEWAEFDSDGTPWLKGQYHKDEKIGYWEWFHLNGDIGRKEFYMI